MIMHRDTLVLAYKKHLMQENGLNKEPLMQENGLNKEPLMQENGLNKFRSIVS